MAVGMVLVRLGWGRGGRGVAVAGWALAGAALLALTLTDGAWGCALGSVAGIAVALVAVLHAGWTSPARRLRPATARTVAAREPLHLRRRAAVFALVVPCAFAATQWLALAAFDLARARGLGEANAVVLALFLQPIAWAVVMAIQLTRAGPARMIAPPLLTALLGTVLWSAA
jgi:hypothetical protein